MQVPDLIEQLESAETESLDHSRLIREQYVEIFQVSEVIRV